MQASAPTSAAATLTRELDWLASVLHTRLQLYFSDSGTSLVAEELPAPAISPTATDAYAHLVRQRQLGWAERLVLALALAPHFRPQALDMLFARNSTCERRFTEFGGRQGQTHAGFLPTGETALFLLAGADLTQRLLYQRHLWGAGPLAELVQLGSPSDGEPTQSGSLTATELALGLLIDAPLASRHFGAGRLAQPLTTPLTWPDLVLPPTLRAQLNELQSWLTHQEVMQQDAHLWRYLTPGYQALFYGPAGTGKTLAAALLGQATATTVYRANAAAIASTYIGETENKLTWLFDMAERQSAILLIDEADALFDKRTRLGSAHHRYASHEISYLFQRMEQFPGLVIVAATTKGNLAEGFARRFNAVLRFPLPGPAEREKLWRQAFAGLPVAPDVNFSALAHHHHVTGNDINNVLRRCALAARQNGRPVSTTDVAEAIQRQVAASN